MNFKVWQREIRSVTGKLPHVGKPGAFANTVSVKERERYLRSP
jgi:hypothetical protein